MSTGINANPEGQKQPKLAPDFPADGVKAGPDSSYQPFQIPT